MSVFSFFNTWIHFLHHMWWILCVCQASCATHVNKTEVSTHTGNDTVVLKGLKINLQHERFPAGSVQHSTFSSCSVMLQQRRRCHKSRGAVFAQKNHSNREHGEFFCDAGPLTSSVLQKGLLRPPGLQRQALCVTAVRPGSVKCNWACEVCSLPPSCQPEHQPLFSLPRTADNIEEPQPTAESVRLQCSRCVRNTPQYPGGWRGGCPHPPVWYSMPI